MVKFISGILALLCLMVTSDAFAQFKIENWTDEDGLPDSELFEIIQSNDGFIWVGTESGLSRFDGVKFKNYTKSNTEGLLSNRIRVLEQGPDSSIWIGTLGGGYSVYKNGKISHPVLEDDENNNYITSVALDSLGNTWFGTDGQGLIKADINSFKRINMDTVFNSNHIFSVGVDLDGKSLVLNAVNNGVAIWESGVKKEFYGFEEGDFHRYNVVFNTAHDGKNLLLGTNNGIFVKTEKEFQHIWLNEYAPGTRAVRDFLIDSKGRYWIATTNGIRVSNSLEGPWEPIKGMPTVSSYSIIEDKEHNIWVSTFGLGLFKLSDSAWSSISEEDGLDVTNTTSIAINDDKVYIGTEEGLFLYQDQEVEKIDLQETLNDNSVQALFTTKLGNVYIGTSNGIPAMVKGNKIERIKRFIPGTNTRYWQVSAIYGDSNSNDIYMGTLRQGLLKWDGENFIQWDGSKGLSNDRIIAITQDHEGGIWAGTNYGLNKLKDDSITVYGFDQGLLTPLTVSLLSDHENQTIWVGSYGGGLFRFKNEHFFQYKEEYGFPFDAVLQMVEDDFGYIWMTTQKGVYRYKKNDLHNLADSLIFKVEYEYYNQQDGLLSNGFAGLQQQTVAKDKKGNIYFATNEGVSIVDPAKLKENVFPPIPYIQDLSIDFNPIEKASILKIEPDQQSFEINYTAINHTAPNEISFEYQLENFNQDWLSVEDQRTAFYTNIPPGEYLFKVRARNNDGVLSKTYAELPVYVKPIFYETWWFRVFILLLVTSLIVGLYQYRMANFRRMEGIRLQIAGDLHDEIGSNLGSVILKSQLISNKIQLQDETVLKGLNEIRTISRNTSQAMRDIVWMINPKHDVVEDLVLQLKEIANTMLEDIDFRFESNQEFSEEAVSPEIRRNVVLILKEVLHNIVKHSKATEVSIIFNKNDKEFNMFVSDNGVGFNLEKIEGRKHYGIDGLYARAKELKGSLIVNSNLSKGTDISLTFKNYGSS